MMSGRRIAPLLAAALLAACGGARKVESAVAAGGGICVDCHGGLDNSSGAPPTDTLGRTDTTLVSVGAHGAHVAAGLDCGACHVKPATVVAPGHRDGQATITWGPLATANGTLHPTFDEGSAACANVYCHGAFRGGNGANAPRWTRVGAGEAACGTCHGLPPPQATGHVQRSGCGGCHAGYTATTVNPATHLNGTVEVGALSCTSCHGDGARTATATNPQLPAAPPLDAAGLQSSAQVGAHQAHLTDGALRPAMPCTECHAVPTTVAGGHPTGSTTFAWGPLATANGALAPTFDKASDTCASVYCHGATLGAGGTNHAPRWTGGAAEVAGCDACHGSPPPAPHPPDARCGRCHPGYDAGVNLALHVNGVRDFLPLTCTSCHGGADNTSGAPPNDTRVRAETTLVSVGAHTAHVAAGLDCGACHVKPATVAAPGHRDGEVKITWGPLATANGALDPTFDETSATCASVYCHGAFPGGNRANAPRWTRVGAGEAACGTCHGLPPPQATGHVQRSGCGDCHAGYTASSVNPATHLNGTVEVGALSCTSCHGDPARAPTATNPQLPAAPPLDAEGLASPDRVGAHQAHLTDGALRPAMRCTECHAVPTTVTGGHPSGTTTFAWDPLLAATRGATPSYAGGACASTYCHGATLGAGGTNHTPRWNGGAAEVATCGTCHGWPPPAPHPKNSRCGGCHPGYDAGVNLAVHVNGMRDLAPMTCTSCHGDAGRLPTVLNPQLPAAPPTDAAGLASSAQVGAHLTHLSGSALAAAVACTECHPVPSAPVNPAVHPDPSGATTLVWGPLATGARSTIVNPRPPGSGVRVFSGLSTTTPAFAGGTCSSTYCHGAYSGSYTYPIPKSDPLELTTITFTGSAAAPSWNGSAACGSCHGIPPATGGQWHSGGHGGGNDCGLCHPDATGTSAANASIVDPAKHVDGKIDLTPAFKSSCFTCH